MANSEEDELLFGDDLLLRELHDGNVDVTAGKRQKQFREHVAQDDRA